MKSACQVCVTKEAVAICPKCGNSVCRNCMRGDQCWECLVKEKEEHRWDDNALRAPVFHVPQGSLDASPGVGYSDRRRMTVCTACGHENAPWLSECSKCHYPLPKSRPLGPLAIAAALVLAAAIFVGILFFRSNTAMRPGAERRESANAPGGLSQDQRSGYSGGYTQQVPSVYTCPPCKGSGFIWFGVWANERTSERCLACRGLGKMTPERWSEFQQETVRWRCANCGSEWVGPMARTLPGTNGRPSSDAPRKSCRGGSTHTWIEDP